MWIAPLQQRHDGCCTRRARRIDDAPFAIPNRVTTAATKLDRENFSGTVISSRPPRAALAARERGSYSLFPRHPEVRAAKQRASKDDGSAVATSGPCILRGPRYARAPQDDGERFIAMV